MSKKPIWLIEPRYCKTCSKQIIPTYHMAKTRWRSGRVKYCSRSCMGKAAFAPYWNKPLSPETYAKISRTKKRKRKWVGSDNPNWGGKISTGRSQTPEQREAIRQRMLNGGAAKARRAQGGKRSSIEVAIERILVRNSIPFIAQHQIENHCVDFLILHVNLVIECDGDYWHSLPEQRKRDKKNNDMLLRMGYEILRLTEREINNDLKACEAKILSLIK